MTDYRFFGLALAHLSDRLTGFFAACRAVVFFSEEGLPAAGLPEPGLL